MTVNFIPCIGVHFLPDVGAGCSCRIANDGGSRSVVERISRAGQPKIQPLGSHGPAVVRLNRDAGTNRFNVLPAELIGDAETVVRRRINGVESSMRAVMGILVAGSVIILGENSRLPEHRSETVCNT